MKTVITLLTLLTAMAIGSTSYAESTTGANEQNETYTPEKSSYLNTLLEEKIEYYRHLYPEIMFMVLQGENKFMDDMIMLDLVLGDKPSSLDYEHPPELREDLMYVSVERIRMMLQSQAPSASLFKVDNPPGWQQQVCVLTINPIEEAPDSIGATRNLLDLPQELMQKIPKDMQLSPDDYLAFVIDHEIYHCLKSMFVGPQLLSQKELWAEYNLFFNEQGADAYAVAMHIKSRGKVSRFAKNILKIRSMALYSIDPGHLTYRGIEQLLKTPIENITDMSANEVFDLANSIKDRLTTSYDVYVRQLASAVQAMQEIGVGELVSMELRNKIKDIQADPVQVKELVAISHCCFEGLSGGELEQ